MRGWKTCRWMTTHCKLYVSVSVCFFLSFFLFCCTVNKEATSEELENLLEKDGAAVFVDNVSIQGEDTEHLTWRSSENRNTTLSYAERHKIHLTCPDCCRYTGSSAGPGKCQSKTRRDTESRKFYTGNKEHICAVGNIGRDTGKIMELLICDHSLMGLGCVPIHIHTHKHTHTHTHTYIRGRVKSKF